MNRRTFLGALSGSLLAAPPAAEAQKHPRRGALFGRAPRPESRVCRGSGSAQLSGHRGMGPPVVAEITRLTASITIIAISSTDLVLLGWAATFARRGGNITGFMLDAGELNAKRFELLKEAVPTLATIALLHCSRSSLRSCDDCA